MIRVRPSVSEVSRILIQWILSESVSKESCTVHNGRS